MTPDERLDAEIDATLAGTVGPSADPVVLWLASALRPEVPASVQRSVDAVLAPRALDWDTRPASARERRVQWPVRLAAAALGLLFASQGLGNLVAGHWVSRNAHIPYSDHLFYESGLVLVAAGLLVGAAALRRRWLGPAVTVGTPLGVVYAIHGIPEITEFAWGAALHLSQGAAALALLAAWWRCRRYSRASSREDR